MIYNHIYERVITFLDENPDKFYTAREIALELGIEYDRAHCASLHKALNIVSKLDGYTVLFERGVCKHKNLITARYASTGGQ